MEAFYVLFPTHEFFGTEKISKLTLKFCIPCFLSLLVSALYNIVDQIFLGNNELSTLGNAVEYFNIILGFFPIYMLSNMINAVARADGSPSWSMFSMLAGAIVNIVLDPVFIFAGKWGMADAARATVIGQAVSFAISIAYPFRAKTFRLTLKSLIPDLKVYGEAFKLGVSSLLTQSTIVVISLVCTIMPAKYGSLRPTTARIFRSP